MSYEMNIPIMIVKFLKKAIGHPGPVIVNVGVHAHYKGTTAVLEKDLIPLGINDHPITFADVEHLLLVTKDMIKQYENKRTYIFSDINLNVNPYFAEFGYDS